jgi:hypothetical protein
VRPGRWVSRLLLVLLAVACTSPAVPVPLPEDDLVRAGRASLLQHWDGPLPIDFHFRSMRCREDGGMVILYDQRGPLGYEGIAVALSGNPRPEPDVWAGGFAPIAPATDPEIRAFFAESPEVPCA